MDFNFFESYKKPKETGKASKYIMCGVASLLILGLLGLSAYSKVRSGQLKEMIETADAKRTSSAYEQAFNELNEKETYTKSAAKTLEYFRALSVALAFNQTVDPVYMDYITDSLPKGAVIVGYSINGADINLQGGSASKIDVAEYEEALRSLGRFKNIGVTSIEKNSEGLGYQFALKMTMDPEPIYSAAADRAMMIDLPGNAAVSGAEAGSPAEYEEPPLDAGEPREFTGNPGTAQAEEEVANRGPAGDIYPEYYDEGSGLQ